MPCTGVDTHAHLDDPAFDADREQVIARAKACGLARIANVILSPSEYPKHAALFASHPEVFFLLGVHPDNAAGFDETMLATIRHHALSDSRIRAIGEIGLDYSRTEPGGATPEEQSGPFRAQLRLARELDLPVAIHCRCAEEDTLNILAEENFAGRSLVWHCFGGNADLARRLADNGWYVSVPGTITFKNNTQAREAVSLIPDDRILLETDCPYLAPDPWRGTRNEPAYTVFTVRTLAACRDMQPEELWALCGRNAARFYRLNEAQRPS